MSETSSHLAPRNDGYASAVKKLPPAAPKSNSSGPYYCTLCEDFAEHRTSQCPLGICAACKQQYGHWPGSPECELADVTATTWDTSRPIACTFVFGRRREHGDSLTRHLEWPFCGSGRRMTESTDLICILYR